MTKIEKQYTVSSHYDMIKLGCRVAKTLKSGTIVCLTGTLGAGKTVFVKGIAKALGIKDAILSPTFTLVQKYNAESDDFIKRGINALYHFDLYRLKDTEEFELIGGREILSSPSIICIEWPEIIRDYLSSLDVVDVHIDITDNNKRIVTIKKY